MVTLFLDFIKRNILHSPCCIKRERTILISVTEEDYLSRPADLARDTLDHSPGGGNLMIGVNETKIEGNTNEARYQTLALPAWILFHMLYPSTTTNRCHTSGDH